MVFAEFNTMKIALAFYLQFLEEQTTCSCAVIFSKKFLQYFLYPAIVESMLTNLNDSRKNAGRTMRKALWVKFIF